MKTRKEQRQIILGLLCIIIAVINILFGFIFVYKLTLTVKMGFSFIGLIVIDIIYIMIAIIITKKDSEDHSEVV